MINQRSGTPFTIPGVFISLWLPITLMAQKDCSLKLEKDSIRIYNCPTTESSFDAIKVEFEANATVEKYLSIVLDIDHYKTWRYHESNHKLLKKVSDHELIYYNQVNAPFPVSNRDLVSRITISQDAITKILTVTTEGIPDYLPPVDKFVRVPKSKSVMTITPLSETRLKASCIIQVNPGGQIPSWLANTFSTQAPYETFKNLIEKMEAK